MILDDLPLNTSKCYVKVKLFNGCLLYAPSPTTSKHDIDLTRAKLSLFSEKQKENQ